jgi:hypothetical protein
MFAELHLAGDSVISDLFPSSGPASTSDDNYPTLLLLQSPGNIFPPEPCYDQRYIHR